MNKNEYIWLHNNNDNSFSYLYKTLKKLISKFKRDISIRDIGCGNGYLTKKITKGFKTVIAIDNSKSAIKFAKKKYKGNIKFINTDLDNFVTKKKFNIILLIEVIEHIYLPDLFLKKIVKLMNKNSILIITTPYHGYLKNLVIFLLNKFDSHFNPLWNYGHIKFWSKKTLTQLLELNNLQINDVFYSGRFFPLSKSMLMMCQKNNL
jgi:2-polyprenyl-6-hydroxyphenyl methylase/3-demethylubiquinone-9 3-methyltransferase